MTKLSPIAIFVYNRHDHFVKTIKYLKKNYLSNKSKIYIFSDGSKKNSDIKPVQKIRNYCKKINDKREYWVDQWMLDETYWKKNTCEREGHHKFIWY